jgi:hypothetical protein
MIPANELRINNWYYIRNVLAGKDEPYQMTSWTQALDLEAYGEPIPLSPKVLEMCGFEKSEYDKMEQWLSPWIERVQPLTKSRIGIMRLPVVGYCYKDAVVNAPTKYLHQLQNLYFALTGKELNIEL